jgi:ribosomal-protein-alanine N-acetyltransferase
MSMTCSAEFPAGAGIAPVGIGAAALLASMHCAAMPDAAWNQAAFASLLDAPGCFALAAPEGFALARTVGDEAELLMLAVLPAFRRRGWGRALVAAACDEARRRGARSLFLEVGESNLPARGLYRAFGAVEVGRRRGYYQAGADAILLRLSLACGT